MKICHNIPIEAIMFATKKPVGNMHCIELKIA